MRVAKERGIYKARYGVRCGETAPGKAKDRGRASGRHIPGDWELRGFGQGSRWMKSFGGVGGRVSDPVVPTE